MPRKNPRNPSLTAAAKKAHEQVKIGFQKSLADYQWLCDLDEVKGLTVGETYRNSCSESSC